jgi:hypothetical protein
MERVQQLLDQRKNKEEELKTLIETSTKSLWTTDLESFLESFEVSLKIASLYL